MGGTVGQQVAYSSMFELELKLLSASSLVYSPHVCLGFLQVLRIPLTPSSSKTTLFVLDNKFNYSPQII